MTFTAYIFFTKKKTNTVYIIHFLTQLYSLNLEFYSYLLIDAFQVTSTLYRSEITSSCADRSSRFCVRTRTCDCNSLTWLSYFWVLSCICWFSIISAALIWSIGQLLNNVKFMPQGSVLLMASGGWMVKESCLALRIRSLNPAWATTIILHMTSLSNTCFQRKESRVN